MKIRCIIVDDEPMARHGIGEEIKEIGFLDIAGTAGNAMQAYELITKEKPELVLLDIQMPGISGLELLKAIKNPPAVIIITAFSEFALEGFDLDVIDYLVKPVPFSRLVKACNKARDFLEGKQQLLKGDKPGKDFFFIKCGTKFEKICLQELLFIEGADNYVIIHTKEKKFITYLTLKNVEEYLPESNYLKVHKSFIVAIDKINHIEGNLIFIKNEKIPIGRAMKEVVGQIISDNLIKRQD